MATAPDNPFEIAAAALIMAKAAGNKPVADHIAAMSEDEIQAAFANVQEGAPPRAEGEVWETNGRRWTLKNGHTVPAAAAGKPSAPPKAVTGKPTPPAPLTAAQKAGVEKHVLPGLEDKIQKLDPTAAAKPGVLNWAKEHATNAMARVSVFIMENHAALGGVLGAVFDTPKDMEKFGYNPSVSSGGHASSIQDPTRDHLGISSHLAATIATHVLTAAITFVRKKAAGRAGKVKEGGNAAELLAELFGILAEEFGLAKPDPAAIAAAVGGK